MAYEIHSDNIKSTEYTVSEVSVLIKKLVEQNFHSITIRGEVSGLRIAPSGHVYFSLKDKGAVLAAICWNGQYNAMAHKPQEGLEVVCTGNITTYQGQSKYQMIVTSIRPAGVGALMALLEKRKKQFQQEGLFDQAHKKPLPYLPRVIGVITSPTGAVIQDIIHRIRDRFPSRIVLWPVLVQGDKSAEQIANAINGFNVMNLSNDKPDILIVARGGGSIEDLWSFNEENVVRAAFASKIPIISAVGHETDVTLIDYVADKRAPTPTAAAEIAVPVKSELAMTLDNLKQQLVTALINHAEHKTQRLDDVSFKLNTAVSKAYDIVANKLTLIKQSLNVNILRNTLATSKTLVEDLKGRLHNSTRTALQIKSKDLSALVDLFASYDYKNTLKRGFALLRDKSNKIIKSVHDVTAGKEFAVELHDGSKDARFNS